MPASPIRNLLIPTDFSACARVAVDAGLQLAERFGASVHLLHVLPPVADAFAPDALQDQHNAEVLLKELREMRPDLDVRLALPRGRLYQIVADYTAQHGVDFIVMGSHGSSGKSEYFIGSRTQRVVRLVHCPILVVKTPVADVRFKKIIYASHFLEDELPVFRHFLDLVRPDLPEIHLVEVNTGSIFGAPASATEEAMQAFRQAAGTLPSQAYLYRDYSPDQGIREFAAELGADLIAVANFHRHPVRRLFAGSTVEALVNHADLPVLSVDLPVGLATKAPTLEGDTKA